MPVKIWALASRFRSLGKAKRSPTWGELNSELEQAQKTIAEKNRRLKRLRERMEEQAREIAALRVNVADGETEAETSGIKPENVVWLFGAGRSGSTWLAAMMGDLPGHRVWPEPQLGQLFDPDRLEVGPQKSGHDSFVFAAQHEESWLKSIGDFVLNGARSRFPDGTEVLVIKEPHGSAGASILLRALPGSRVILLVRDPRDTIASALDAFEKGMWKGDVWRGMYGGQQDTPDAFVEGAARSYLRHVGNAWGAYEAHEGRKALIRYEDLRSDTLATMKRIYSTLDIHVDDEILVQAVEKHSWESVPGEEKGQGKFYRKANPGSWKEDLTEEQAAVVERITRPIIKEFYPDLEQDLG